MKPGKAGEKHYPFIDKEQRHRKIQSRMSINSGRSTWDAQEPISPCAYDLFACFSAAVSLGTGRAGLQRAAQSSSQGTRWETAARQRGREEEGRIPATSSWPGFAQAWREQGAEGKQWCDFVGAFWPSFALYLFRHHFTDRSLLLGITSITKGVQHTVQISCSLVKTGENHPSPSLTWAAALHQ